MVGRSAGPTAARLSPLIVFATTDYNNHSKRLTAGRSIIDLKRIKVLSGNGIYGLYSSLLLTANAAWHIVFLIVVL